MNLSQISGVVMDMDGVIWRGDEVLPGAHALFNRLRERGLPFVAATNNSSKSPADYTRKLSRIGIEGVSEDSILTSGKAAVNYLQQHYPAGTAVHVVGGDGLKGMVARAGYELADVADVVVVGIDFHLTYGKIKRAAYLIRAGAEFIGTNSDRTFPMPDGLAPGAGSLLAALQTATDRDPIIMGKPNRPMFEAALRVLGTTPAATLMIGDRLDTDILGAQAAGLKTALVLTGVTTRAELAASPIQADSVYAGLPDLLAEW